LIQVLWAFVGSEFDVVEVKEVGASRLKFIVKMNRLPDGTHRGRVLDDGDKTTREWQTLNGLMTNTRTTTQSQQDGDPERVGEIEQTRYTWAANNARWRCIHMFLV